MRYETDLEVVEQRQKLWHTHVMDAPSHCVDGVIYTVGIYDGLRCLLRADGLIEEEAHKMALMLTPAALEHARWVKERQEAEA